MKINILISTIDKGIEKVEDVVLEPRNDVSYIVSHQFTEEKYKVVPDALKRDDIKLSHIEGAGVAISRNNAIRLADGDIAIFSDDDVSYLNSDIDAVKETFLQNDEADLGVFKIRTPEGEPEYKNYPDKTIEYQKPPSVGTVQIAFKVNKIQENNIFFDERFGAGQPLLIADDERLFLYDCINSGLRVFFFPKYIVEHPYISTTKGIPKYDKRKIWVAGGIDCRMNGPFALIKAFLGTVKIMPDLLKHGVNPLSYFYHRISAVIHVLMTNKERTGKQKKQNTKTVTSRNE